MNLLEMFEREREEGRKEERANTEIQRKRAEEAEEHAEQEKKMTSISILFSLQKVLSPV